MKGLNVNVRLDQFQLVRKLDQFVWTPKSNITKQPNQKLISVRHLIFHCLTVVCYFVAWKKGLTLNIYMLCFVVTNSVCSFNLFYAFVTGMFFTKVCMYVWACIHMHMQTSACMQAQARVCISASMHAYVKQVCISSACVHTHTCSTECKPVYACACMCKCLCVRAHAWWRSCLFSFLWFAAIVIVIFRLTNLKQKTTIIIA